MNIVFEENKLEFDEISHPGFEQKKIKLSIARLDKIHPVVSGNKLFKLHYFLEEAVNSSHKKIITFGGAYSNHLLATAYAANNLGLHAIGIVRGEKPRDESRTLELCRESGMQLHYISRASYKNIQEPAFLNNLKKEFGERVIIPEGGFSHLGAKGASLIMERLQLNQPTHICVAVGTATTLAGLLQGSEKGETIIGFPVLKNMTDIGSRLTFLNIDKYPGKLNILDEYHFGGYAKTTPELISFMNDFYTDHKVPLDFIYTAKMMYGTMEKIDQHYFREGSNIICLHTGGLQGNISLEKGTLVY